MSRADTMGEQGGVGENKMNPAVWTTPIGLGYLSRRILLKASAPEAGRLAAGETEQVQTQEV